MDMSPSLVPSSASALSTTRQSARRPADGFLSTVASEGRFVFSTGFGVIVLSFRSTNVVAGAAFEAYLPAPKT